ncbi:Glutathione synthase/RimK-type ligase, ATP-grasp superfamily [Microbacterium sp. ru370.1]|uniref:ATP-grasp domain-containing protein n=1 Tax=unclassified Microbacterium TaxID=2609290 RepID=UPI00088D3E58|nr:MULTISPECIES: alpha-L-glutamate ligase [unclassified Microbacterium]SDO33575.1 Glutathione synthase/RimK-type ligase, ATP-grasp superfamily [Microbacterium sp. ru370.1]SIT77127.1 Glutathione synthase/RimK-type ligase, ATP-grasp superfamily [Microbacterium sp. RU1D]
MSGKVYVIHENPQWIPPFAAAFEAEGVPFEEWMLTDGSIDLAVEPPEGIFWSRLSASAHTRDHAHSKEFGRAVLRWLASWGRTVINGADVLELEVSKVAQHAALRHAGIDVPRTVAVFGTDDLVSQAEQFGAPFISKHNQGGKGLGVRRWETVQEFAAWVGSPDFEPSPDGITLLQELLVATSPFITRAEFVAGEFVYAVRVDTSAGSFELCPAEACAVPGADGAEPEPLFRRRDDVDPALTDRYLAFLAAEGVGIAGIEFIETRDGRTVTYDVNTNTNYNPDVEATAPRSGPREIARWLGSLLPQEAVGLRG